MSTTPGDRSWGLPILRAVPAAVIALVITFSANHSTFLGYLALGGFAVVTGAILVVGALRGELPRIPFLVQGAVALVGGGIALIVNQAPLPLLLFLSSTVLGVTGSIELFTGISLRGRAAAARDWIFIGALSAVFSLVALAIPADFVDVISLPDKTVPALTASVVLVGLIGAYCAIIAVYLTIAGLSLKWSQQPGPVTVSADG